MEVHPSDRYICNRIGTHTHLPHSQALTQVLVTIIYIYIYIPFQSY